MKHELTKLGYEYDSLEPFIDEETMKIHHTKHHQAYIDKLNKALEKYPKLQEKPIEELIADLNKIPKEIRTTAINNGGGHANHSFFWRILKKDIMINGEILKEINKTFNSFDGFKEKFKESALNLFGSGWTWLVLSKGKLEIINTTNQDSVISKGKIPLLNLDLWEHAYYLKYQNKRADYIDGFFNVINWDAINKNFLESKR